MASEKMTAPAALSKSQQAYLWIRERIVSKEFAPGHKLVLASIAADTDMSVVPVREAVRQLEAEGLITFERNIGAHVAMVNDSQYRDSMNILAIVEGAATALAARQLAAEDLRRARTINGRMIETLEPFDPHTFTALNHSFHRVLFSKCPNARLLEIVDAEWARLANLRDSTFSFVPDRAWESVREHESIVTLIEQEAPLDEIERVARQHRQSTLDAYLMRQRAGSSPGLATI